MTSTSNERGLRRVVLDDSSARIRYSEGWNTESALQGGNLESGAPYQASQHTAAREGASLQFSYTGSRIVVYGTNSPPSTSRWTCMLDSTPLPAVPPSGPGAAQWPLCDSGPNTQDGAHHLSFSLDTDGPVSIDSIQYFPSLSDTDLEKSRPDVRFEPDDRGIAYSGSDGAGSKHWTMLDVEGAVVRMSKEAGASVSVHFNGTELVWFGSVFPGHSGSRGKVKVSIDGQAGYDVDLPVSEKTIHNATILRVGQLYPALPHVVTVTLQENGSGAPLTLGYLVVKSGDVLGPPLGFLDTADNLPGGMVGGAQPKPSTVVQGRRIPVGAIVGGVLGGVAFLCIVGVVVACFVRRRRRKRDAREGGMKESLDDPPISRILVPQRVPASQDHSDSTSQFELKAAREANSSKTALIEVGSSEGATPMIPVRSRSKRSWGLVHRVSIGSTISEAPTLPPGLPPPENLENDGESRTHPPRYSEG